MDHNFVMERQQKFIPGIKIVSDQIMKLGHLDKVKVTDKKKD